MNTSLLRRLILAITLALLLVACCDTQPATVATPAPPSPLPTAVPAAQAIIVPSVVSLPTAPSTPTTAPPTAMSPTLAPTPQPRDTPTMTPIPAATATPRRAQQSQPTGKGRASLSTHYTFPVRSDGKISYGRYHHDYPAADIFCPVGSQFVAVTEGVVDFVSYEDKWDPKVNDGATRGGLSVAIIGDDGVRYYGSHLSKVADEIA